jgi:4-hydroxy-2-oxoheptanedioate aldolase
MRTSKVKTKLSRGEPVLVPALHFIDPSVYELTSLMGFDCIWMDLEHHGYGVETAGNLMRAARVGSADLMARPAKGEFMRMGRLLEAGAQGIMYPRCDNADEARQVVRWSKFAPLGTRGFDGGNADAPYCSMAMDCYIREANAQTFLVLQIEDLQAVDNARAIAEVEGVDVLFVGPADLSILSGVPGQFDHPLVQDAIRKVAQAAKQAGKDWGTTSPSAARTKELLDQGARFICQGCDIVMVKQGMEKLRQDAAAMGFTFDGRL